MGLDLSALHEIGKSTGTDEKAVEKPNTTPQGQEKVHTTLQLKQEDHRKAAAAYDTYQENIKRAGILRAEILKGVRAGEPPTALLLKAVKCISLMTGEKVFYDQIRGDVLTIWAEGLQDETALEMKLQDVEGRLKKIEEALKREDLQGGDRERIQKAAEQHQKQKEALEKTIEQQKTGATA